MKSQTQTLFLDLWNGVSSDGGCVGGSDCRRTREYLCNHYACHWHYQDHHDYEQLK